MNNYELEQQAKREILEIHPELTEDQLTVAKHFRDALLIYSDTNMTEKDLVISCVAAMDTVTEDIRKELEPVKRFLEQQGQFKNKGV